MVLQEAGDIARLVVQQNKDTVAALLDLPFSEILIETEENALLYCPEYDNVRESAPNIAPQ